MPPPDPNKLNGLLWQAVVPKLYLEHYKVAVVSRSQSDPTEGKALPLTKEGDIVSAFKQVKKTPPNVVVYNCVIFNSTQIFDQPAHIPCGSGSSRPSTSY
jgi:hypothetical protein